MWTCYHPCLKDADGYLGIYYGFDPAKSCAGTLIFSRGATGGCFAGETLIQMGDGNKKRADNIRAGDYVFNPSRAKPVKVLKVVAGPENEALLAVEVAGHTVKVSQEHPFMTRLGPVAIHNLRPGDLVMAADQRYHPINTIHRIEPTKEPVTVWNFVLDGDDSELSHTLVGDGVLSGDLVLQRQPINYNLVSYAFGQ
jgi:hypothetical protein